MSRPRILYILSSLAANDLGDEIVTILGRLSRSKYEPRVIALGGREELLGRIVEMKVRLLSPGTRRPDRRLQGGWQGQEAPGQA